MKTDIILLAVGGGIGMPGTIAGVVLSDLLARCRETRQREQTKRSLAAALCSELEGLADRADELLAGSFDEQGRVLIAPGARIVWSAEESYFAVYDSAADRLGLLPQEVLRELVAAYTHAKAAVDTVRIASEVSADADPRDSARALLDAAKAVSNASRQLRALIPKLDAIARGRT